MSTVVQAGLSFHQKIQTRQVVDATQQEAEYGEQRRRVSNAPNRPSVGAHGDAPWSDAEVEGFPDAAGGSLMLASSGAWRSTTGERGEALPTSSQRDRVVTAKCTSPAAFEMTDGRPIGLVAGPPKQQQHDQSPAIVLHRTLRWWPAVQASPRVRRSGVRGSAQPSLTACR